MPLTIAIDGPVGAGKSTISDAVAKSLNILHLDTGAMYRAVGLGALDLNADPEDEEKVVSLLQDGKILVDVKYEDGRQVTLLNGVSVNDRIRTQEAGGAASTTRTISPLRPASARTASSASVPRRRSSCSLVSSRKSWACRSPRMSAMSAKVAARRCGAS